MTLNIEGNLITGSERLADDDGDFTVSQAQAALGYDKTDSAVLVGRPVTASAETLSDESAATALDAAGTTPTWHDAVEWPADVRAARQGLNTALEAAEQALDDVAELDSLERAEVATEAARVRQLIAAGKPTKPVKGSDFAEARRFRRAVLAGHVQLCRDARRAYDEKISTALPAVAAELEVSLPERRASAVEAVEAARSSFAAMLAKYFAATEAARALEPQGEAVGLRAEVMFGAPAALDMVRQALDDDVLSGRRPVHNAQMDPPYSWRRGVAAGAAQVVGGVTADWLLLARTEVAEKFSVTDFTRGTPADLLARSS